MKTATYKIRWHLISWEALLCGLNWWAWKPVIEVKWKEPTGGMAGNGLSAAEVSWSINWLSFYFQLTINKL